MVAVVVVVAVAAVVDDEVAGVAHRAVEALGPPEDFAVEQKAVGARLPRPSVEPRLAEQRLHRAARRVLDVALGQLSEAGGPKRVSGRSG